MKLYKYRAVLKHDKGLSVLYIVARNKIAAKQCIMIAENCPERAIITLQRSK